MINTTTSSFSHYCGLYQFVETDQHTIHYEHILNLEKEIPLLINKLIPNLFRQSYGPK